MAKRSEGQLHESVQKALIKHFPPERNDSPAVGGYKSFYRRTTHLLCYLLGMGNPLQSLTLAIMELQVKELQKADVKACCLHDESSAHGRQIQYGIWDT